MGAEGEKFCVGRVGLQALVDGFDRLPGFVGLEQRQSGVAQCIFGACQFGVFEKLRSFGEEFFREQGIGFQKGPLAGHVGGGFPLLGSFLVGFEVLLMDRFAGEFEFRCFEQFGVDPGRSILIDRHLHECSIARV